jgi:hypothetical protein
MTKDLEQLLKNLKLRRVLEIYDEQVRALATQLYERGVPLIAVENALVLAAARRLARPAGFPPHPTIRSLAYFTPVIEEVLRLDVGQQYFEYTRNCSNGTPKDGRPCFLPHHENHPSQAGSGRRSSTGGRGGHRAGTRGHTKNPEYVYCPSRIGMVGNL